MQREIDSVATSRGVRIFGINQAGQEAGNGQICSGRTLPWLQDTPDVDVWGLWKVTWRDVVVLDADNLVIRTYNLSVNDLQDSTKYAELKNILVDAAR